MNDNNTEIVATCEAAISYLTEHGVARGKFLRDDETACIAGAVLIAHGGVGVLSSSDVGLGRAVRSCPAIPAVAASIVKLWPDRIPANPYVIHVPPSILFLFNDHKDTTPEDVIEALRETIKRHTPDQYRTENAG